MSRPRLLYVTPNSPTAPAYGAQMRACHVARILQRHAEVSVVVASWRKPPAAELDAARSLFGDVRYVPLRVAPVRGPWQRLRHEFDPSFFGTSGYAAAEEDVAATRALVASHDVTWVHHFIAADSLRLAPAGPSLLDVDDVLSRYHVAEATTASGLRRLRLLRRAWIWRRRERRALRRFRRLAVCSEDDRRYFGGDPRVHVIPNGFELASPPPPPAPQARLGMIGTFEYAPNYDGLAWFRTQVWPRVLGEVPEAELRVVGHRSEACVDPRDPRVTPLGWLADPGPEMATWSASIVPVLVGGGTRIKIAEAFARGVPVVATTVGAFGYEVASGRELLIADDPAAFASACVSLLTDPELRARLTEAGRAFHRERHTWEAVAPAVERALAACFSG